MISEFLNPRRAGSTPRACRIRPSKANSPKKTVCESRSEGMRPWAASSATAMGKSKCEPDLGNQAGESETVTFLFGQRSWELSSAERIRSRDSDKARSGKPKSEYVGRPSEISTSI